MRHLDEFTDQLSAYLDQELNAAARNRLEAHLAGCFECRAVLADLRDIVAAAPLYEGTPPAADHWPALAARLGEAEVVAFPTGRAPRETVEARQEPRRHMLRFSLPELIAASIVMAAVGAGGAWLAVRGESSGTALTTSPATASTAPDSSIEPAPARPVSLAEADYDAAVADLERVLIEGRSRLDTTTVRVIDESLARIDTAIAEARAAIQRDPANAYLTRQIAASMRRKLNLLRTAAKAIAEL